MNISLDIETAIKRLELDRTGIKTQDVEGNPVIDTRMVINAVAFGVTTSIKKTSPHFLCS